MLGAWGGQTISHFDEPPLSWTQPFWIILGIREFNYDKWSNLMLWETTPIGAGMRVRRIVTEKYAGLVRNDPRRSNLGRKGKSLVGCEDLDMAYTSCDLGLGTGLFASLKLLHLMPASRQWICLCRTQDRTASTSVQLKPKVVVADEFADS